MRHLVIATDGTWNKPDQKDQHWLVPSNVVKIARAVDEHDPEIEQVKYYDPGVGTAGWFDKIRGGVTGAGLFKNMRQAYAWLIRNHRPEDRLFLFGFSRGAFTARSLAGMLGLCGIPKSGREPEELAIEAAKAYRIKDPEKRAAACGDFFDRHECSPGEVHVLGVWDTVGALGLPTRGLLGKLTRARHSFHDVSLGANIRHAYHAVAINERRGPFEPTLWRGETPQENQTVIQAWFPGVHSNIGGGYLDAGLSDRALYWMIHKAQEHGLRFNDVYIERRIDPNWFGELRDSMQWYYRTCLTGCPGPRKIGTGALGECIHFSAVERWTSPSRPDGMPESLQTALAADIPAIRERQEAEFHIKMAGKQRR